MRVLMAHCRYRGLLAGGEDHSTKAEAALLRDQGHHVTLIERPNSEVDAITSIGRQIWSRHAYLLTQVAIEDTQPDIVYFQNTAWALGPAAIQAASDMGVPVVAALRNERLLLGWGDALRGTYNGSRLQTAALAAGNAIHVRHTWQRHVDVLVPVSEYVRGKFIAAGFDPEQLVAKPNVVYPEPRFVPTTAIQSEPSTQDVPTTETHPIRRRLLFVGRDTPEKGLHVLLEALDLMGDAAPPLLVVGVAPVPRIYGVQFLGPVPHARVLDLMAESMAVVVPSVWPEPFGRVAIEAQAVGTPVIASDVGGLPETHPLLLTMPSDIVDLAAVIKLMTSWYDDPDSEIYQVRRRTARATYEWHFSPARQAQHLEAILARAVDRRQARTVARPADAVA